MPPFVYERRKPEQTTLYAVVRDNVETLYAATRESGTELPAFVRGELEGYLDCGLLCRGFAHLKCEGCSERRWWRLAARVEDSALRAWVGGWRRRRQT